MKISYTLFRHACRIRRIVNKRRLELTEIENLLTKHIREAVLKLPSYDWARIQEYMKNLESRIKAFNPETYPGATYGKATSFTFIESKEDIQDNYWFTALKEIFNNYGLT